MPVETPMGETKAFGDTVLERTSMDENRLLVVMCSTRDVV